MFDKNYIEKVITNSPYKLNISDENISEINLSYIKSVLKVIPDKKDYEKNTKFLIGIKEYIIYICKFCLIKSRELFNILDIGKNLLNKKLDLAKYLKMIDQLNSI